MLQTYYGRASAVVLLIIVPCASCQISFLLTPSVWRTRLRKSSVLYCSGSCARRSRPAQPKAQAVCSNCNQTFELLPSKVKTRLAGSESGLLFCSKNCTSRYFYTSGRTARLQGLILKRQPNWTDLQAHWEQILHNIGLGEGVAMIRNSTDLLAIRYSEKREGRWWEEGLTINDGTFKAGSTEQDMDDGKF